MVFEDSKYGPLLAGQDSLKDRAVGDKVEMTIGAGGDVRLSSVSLLRDKNKQHWTLEVSNARKSAVKIEIKIPYELKAQVKGIAKVDGVPTWKAMVPANGTAKIDFDLKTGGQ